MAPASSSGASRLAHECRHLRDRRDGTGLRQLTTNPTDDGLPVFSPDGSKIAFTSDRVDGTGQVFVMNADGTARPS